MTISRYGIKGICLKTDKEVTIIPELIEATTHDSKGRKFILSGIFKCPEYDNPSSDCPYIMDCELFQDYKSLSE